MCLDGTQCRQGSPDAPDATRWGAWVQDAQDVQDEESRLGESARNTTVSDPGHLFADELSYTTNIRIMQKAFGSIRAYTGICVVCFSIPKTELIYRKTPLQRDPQGPPLLPRYAWTDTFSPPLFCVRWLATGSCQTSPHQHSSPNSWAWPRELSLHCQLNHSPHQELSCLLSSESSTELPSCPSSPPCYMGQSS